MAPIRVGWFDRVNFKITNTFERDNKRDKRRRKRNEAIAIKLCAQLVKALGGIVEYIHNHEISYFADGGHDKSILFSLFFETTRVMVIPDGIDGVRRQPDGPEDGILIRYRALGDTFQLMLGRRGRVISIQDLAKRLMRLSLEDTDWLIFESLNIQFHFPANNIGRSYTDDHRTVRVEKGLEMELKKILCLMLPAVDKVEVEVHADILDVWTAGESGYICRIMLRDEERPAYPLCNTKWPYKVRWVHL